MRWRGPVLLGALWAFAASAATGVGLVAVHRVAGQVGDQISTPLSDRGVQQALAAVTPAATPADSSSPAPRATSTAGTGGELRTVRTRGGIVGAHCEEGQPQLVYVTPAQGWRTDRNRDTLVRFISSRQAVTVRLSCAGDVLGSTSRTDDLSPRSSHSPSPSPSPQPSPYESSDSPEPSPSEHSTDGSGDR